MNSLESMTNESSQRETAWDVLSKVEFAGSRIQSEPWSSEEHKKQCEAEVEMKSDIDGVPQTMWRGERVYLKNIDEVGVRDLSTVGHERTNNRNGELSLARDKYLASTYAFGTDGVEFYDAPLAKEEIPIGVVYKINNDSNHLGVQKPDWDPESFGPYEGKYRELIANVVPAKDYTVEDFYIMDDFLQPNGHERSDFRRPMEVFKVKDQKDLPKIIAAVKDRMDELDKNRKK